MSGLHGQQTVDNGIHIPYQWVYANETARTGASGFSALDLGKFCRQTDDNSIWMLTATTPTWVHIGGLSTTLTINRTSATTEGELIYTTAGTVEWYAGMVSDDYTSAGSEYFIGTTTKGLDAEFFIQPSTDGGRVGINTISPSTKLHVYDDAATQILVESATTSSYSRVQLTADTGYLRQSIRGSAASGTTFGIAQANLAEITSGFGSMVIGTASNYDLYFGTNSSVNMTIDSSTGNVGIGTTSPRVHFDVTGNWGLSGPSPHRISAFGTGTQNINFEAADITTDNFRVRVGRATNTTGGVAFEILRGDGTASSQTLLNGYGDSYINILTGSVLIGSASSNTFMTQGVTIQQGANDDEAFAVKSSDVSHPFTSLAENDTFFDITKNVSSSGGATLRGFSSGARGIVVQGFLVNEDTSAASTSSNAAIRLQAFLTDGSDGQTALSTSGNVLAVYNQATARYIFKGGGAAYADDDWYTFSDERKKRDIMPMTGNVWVDKLMALTPSSFTHYSADIHDGDVILEKDTGRHELGFIAQEVLPILPEAVTVPADVQNGFYGMHDKPIVALLVAVVQQQQKRIQALEAIL